MNWEEQCCVDFMIVREMRVGLDDAENEERGYA